jgi:hypothetical protein
VVLYDFMINLNEVKIVCRLFENFKCLHGSYLVVIVLFSINQSIIITSDDKFNIYYLCKMFKIIYFILLFIVFDYFIL